MSSLQGLFCCVMMPTLPKNMKTMRMSFEAVQSAGVMPVVRPTVQRADTVS